MDQSNKSGKIVSKIQYLCANEILSIGHHLRGAPIPTPLFIRTGATISVISFNGSTDYIPSLPAILQYLGKQHHRHVDTF